MKKFLVLLILCLAFAQGKVCAASYNLVVTANNFSNVSAPPISGIAVYVVNNDSGDTQSAWTDINGQATFTITDDQGYMMITPYGPTYYGTMQQVYNLHHNQYLGIALYVIQNGD